MIFSKRAWSCSNNVWPVNISKQVDFQYPRVRKWNAVTQNCEQNFSRENFAQSQGQYWRKKTMFIFFVLFVGKMHFRDWPLSALPIGCLERGDGRFHYWCTSFPPEFSRIIYYQKGFFLNKVAQSFPISGWKTNLNLFWFSFWFSRRWEEVKSLCPVREEEGGQQLLSDKKKEQQHTFLTIELIGLKWDFCNGWNWMSKESIVYWSLQLQLNMLSTPYSYLSVIGFMINHGQTESNLFPPMFICSS